MMIVMPACANRERHAECYRWYSSTIDTCQYCLAEGHCVRGSLTDRSDFVCICPRCHYGSICQHNTQLLSFTLESLLTTDLLSANRSTRLLATCFFLLIPLIFFLVGLLNNLSAAMTFRRPKIAQIGVGHYLIWTCWLAQLSLLALIMKIVHVIIGTQGLMHESVRLNRWMCKVVTFALSASTRTTYWLTALVSIERVYISIYPTGTQLKKPMTAKVLIAIVLAMTVASHVQELLFYDIVQDPKYSEHGQYFEAEISFDVCFHRYVVRRPVLVHRWAIGSGECAHPSSGTVHHSSLLHSCSHWHDCPPTRPRHRSRRHTALS